MEAFILALFKSVGIQIVGVFGIFFVFGYILSVVQHWTHGNYQRSVGWKGILWTAWIGTPVHEVGHVLFAKLFRHKITHVSLFRPNKSTGGLGHVEHSFHQKSIFQKIGNFFIGSAPMIFGSLVLVLLLRLLVPNGAYIFSFFQGDYAHISSLADIVRRAAIELFSRENVESWRFWLFIYTSFCVASHIAPSRQDRRGMWRGFAWIVFLLLLVNAAALAFGADLTALVLRANQALTLFTSVFLYSIVISLFHLFASFILLFPFRK
jgi:hypothetical protein